MPDSWKYVLFVVIVSCLGSSILLASQWTSFTNVNTVRSFAFDQARSEILIASWGGALTFQPDAEEISVQGRVDGFSSVDFTGVEIDQDGRLILSTADRGIDIQFNSGAIRNYTDLDGLPSNDVLFLTLNGDDIWVGTTKGAAQLRLEGEILQPRNLFFAEPRNLEVREIAFHGDTTAFATNDGLWLLTGESTFQLLSTDDGLLDNSVRCLFYDTGGGLYLGTESGVQLLQSDGTLTDMIDGLSGNSLIANDILLWNTDLWLATNGGVFSHDLTTWVNRTEDLGTSKSLSLFVTPDNFLYVGTSLGGFGRREESGWKVWTLPGPSTNFLTNVVIDNRGVLWTSTWKVSRSESSLGRYDGSMWYSYTESNSDLPLNSASSLSVAPDSSIWTGTPWFNNTNSGSSGLSVLDDSGTTDPEDDSWWLFPASTTGLSSDAIRAEVVFKGENNAWIGSWEQNSFGMRGGLDLLQDYRGAANFRSFVDFLRDDEVNALALDQQGNLWIGYTEVGVDVFVLEPPSGTDSLLLQIDQDEIFLLSGSINDLKVGPENHLWIASASGVNEVDFQSDPANRSGYVWRSFTRENTGGGLVDLLIRDIEFQGNRFVWFATPSGVSRYDRVADKWEVFSETNSNLIDNRVWDISVDDIRNKIWISTEKGISRYDPLGDIPPANDSKKITIFPNPFVPSQGHTGVSLGPFSSPISLTIYSLKGTEIRKIGSEEEWVRWDGKDASGDPVPSGVYLVVSRSDGSNTATGKIAVVR
jgi:ligand-binding sensor domain-containing protein